MQKMAIILKGLEFLVLLVSIASSFSWRIIWEIDFLHSKILQLKLEAMETNSSKLIKY
jgi:hypothetical protein